MNKTVIVLIALTLLTFCFDETCPAQESIAEEPIVHTVDFPNGDAAWRVTFQPEQVPGQTPPPKPKDKQMTSIDIVRKGSLRHDVVTWSDGSLTNYWWSGNAFVLFQDGQDGPINVRKAGNMQGSTYDQNFFTWISKDNFKGKVTFQDQKCRYYEMTVITINGDTATVRGWINNKTSRPVGWTESQLLDLFTFDLPVPPEPLVMPPAFQKELNRFQSFFVFPKRATPAAGGQ